MSTIRALRSAIKCSVNIILSKYSVCVVCISLIMTGVIVLRSHDVERINLESSFGDQVAAVVERWHLRAEDLQAVSRVVADVERINLESSFDDQVAAVVERRQLRAEDLQAVSRVVADVERALQLLWPDAKLVLLGSLVTGLAIPNGDVDCHVILPSSHGETSWNRLLEAAASTMQSHPDLFTNITVHINRVPIVNAVHVPTTRYFDIGVTEGAHVSNLLKYLLHLDGQFLRLAVVVKYWVELLNRKGERKVASHFFIILVIFFLQQKRLLPPVVELQNNIEPLMKKHWNIAFQRKDYRPRSNLNLFSLLVGYFEFYANFPFEDYVISPYVGYPIHRARFAHYQNLPEEFRLYKFNVANNITSPMNLLETIIVQEPFYHNLNVITPRTMPSHVIQRVIAAFKKAKEVYENNNNPDEFLVSILANIL